MTPPIPVVLHNSITNSIPTTPKHQKQGKQGFEKGGEIVSHVYNAKVGSNSICILPRVAATNGPEETPLDSSKINFVSSSKVGPTYTMDTETRREMPEVRMQRSITEHNFNNENEGKPKMHQETPLCTWWKLQQKIAQQTLEQQRGAWKTRAETHLLL